MSFHNEDKQRVLRGTVTVIIGAVLQLGTLGALLLSRALYGGDAFGTFAISWAAVALLSRFVVGGFADAIVYFTSLKLHEPTDGPVGVAKREDALYRSISTCLIVPFAISLVAVGAIYLAAEPLYETVWAAHDPIVAEMLKQLSWMLPLSVLVRLPVDAVKAHLNMKWAVLVSDSLLPMGQFLGVLFFWAVGVDALGMVYAVLLAHAICLPVAWYGFSRHFCIRRALRKLVTGSYEPGVLGFALPQSLNMMFSYGLARVDALMLSAFVNANIIGIYTLASDLVRSIRIAKTSVATVLAPLVAKYKAQDNRQGMGDALQEISRWTAVLSLPLLFAVVAFTPDFAVGPGRPWEYSPWIPWMLAVGPMFSCFFGLAGNVLLMTGHSRLLLCNSTVMAALNIALNYCFIPRWGLFGAALATMIANGAISCTQIVELRLLEKLSFSWRKFSRPILVGVLCSPAIGLLYMAEVHQQLYQLGSVVGILLKVAIVAGVIAVYSTTILFWPGDNPEREQVRRRWRARRA